MAYGECDRHAFMYDENGKIIGENMQDSSKNEAAGLNPGPSAC